MNTLLAWGGLGGMELLVIFFVILLLFGAKRLPELAKSLGVAKKEFQKAAREVSDEVEKPAPTETPKSQTPTNGDASKKA